MDLPESVIQNSPTEHSGQQVVGQVRILTGSCFDQDDILEMKKRIQTLFHFELAFVKYFIKLFLVSFWCFRNFFKSCSSLKPR